MDKKLKATLGTIAVISVSLTAGVIWKQLTKPTPEEIRQEIITEIVKRINDESKKYTYPIKLNDEIQLDSMRATRRAIIYKYTMCSNEIFSESAEELFRKQLKDTMCSDKTIRRIMQYGFSYIYQYYTPQGKPLSTTILTAEDCYH